MVENDAVWKRYVQILTYKLTKYTNKDFMDKISRMSTKDKIKYLTDLKTDLDNVYIFKKDVNIPEENIIPIMREIYSFLYDGNNVFSQKSYLRQLKELDDLERFAGKNSTFHKIEVEKLEEAFVEKMQWKINKIINLTKDKTAKSKIKALFDAQYRILHLGAIAFMLFIGSIMLYYNISANSNQPPSKYPTEEVTRKNQIREKLRQIIGIDRQKPQVGNVLTNSANFLQLADTCTAWAIIRSLENMKIHSDVKVIYPHNFTEESTDTTPSQNVERRKRFAKLCSLAVNYTINEYSAYNSAIKSYPKNMNITFVNSDTLRYNGIHIRETGEIRINESSLTLDNGANALMLFCTIAHEVVHRLVEYNFQYSRSEEEYYKKLTELKARGIQPSATDIDEYIELVLKNHRYTETEAYKFYYKIFHEFFKGIIIDVEKKFEFEGKQIHPPSHMIEFAESYLKTMGVNDFMKYLFQSDEDRQKIIGEVNATILKNLRDISMYMLSLDEMLIRVNADKYDKLRENLYKMREEMLQDNTTHISIK